MGKRLTRVSGTKMRLSFPQLIGHEATLVMLNGSTFYGTIEQVKEDTCQLKDFRNHKHTVSITQIAEIITDTVSSY